MNELVDAIIWKIENCNELIVSRYPQEIEEFNTRKIRCELEQLTGSELLERIDYYSKLIAMTMAQIKEGNEGIQLTAKD